MILNAIYRLPIWYNLNKQDRVLRLFVVGLVLYIALYFYLNSTYSDNLQLIKSYKDYIYYLICIDLILFVYTFYTDDTKRKKRNKQRNKHPMRIPNNRFIMHQNMPKPLFIKNPNLPIPIIENPKDDESIGIPLYEPKQKEVESIDLPIYGN